MKEIAAPLLAASTGDTGDCVASAAARQAAAVPPALQHCAQVGSLCCSTQFPPQPFTIWSRASQFVRSDRRGLASEIWLEQAIQAPAAASALPSSAHIIAKDDTRSGGLLGACGVSKYAQLITLATFTTEWTVGHR